MSRITFLIALGVMILISSCSEDAIQESEFAVANSDYKVEQILEMPASVDQKLAYSLLSKNQKQELWNKKINQILVSDRLVLNGKQKDLLNELLNKINNNVDVFGQDKNEYSDYFKYVYVPDFIKRSEKLFTNDQILSMFSNFSSIDVNYIQQNRIGDAPIGEKECNCNESSAISCTFNTVDCVKGGCRETIASCGFLGFFECNGRCDFF